MVFAGQDLLHNAQHLMLNPEQPSSCIFMSLGFPTTAHNKFQLVDALSPTTTQLLGHLTSLLRMTKDTGFNQCELNNMCPFPACQWATLPFRHRPLLQS